MIVKYSFIFGVYTFNIFILIIWLMNTEIDEIIHKFADGDSQANLHDDLSINNLNIKKFRHAKLHEHKSSINYLLKRRGVKLDLAGYASHLLRNDINASVYDFMLALIHDEVDLILPLVNNIKSIKNDTYYTNRLILIIAGLSIFNTVVNFNPQMLKIISGYLYCQWHLFEKYLTILANIGAVGSVLNLIASIYTFFNIIFDPTKTTSKKIINLSFLLVSTGLNQAAYIILIAAGGVMGPAVALLFIAASLIDFLQYTYECIKSLIEINQLNITTSCNTKDEQITYIQKLIMYNRKKTDAISSLIFAAATTAIVTLWVLFPPSIIASAACVVGLAILGIAQYFIKNHIDKIYDEKIQTAVKEFLDETDEYNTDPEVNLKTETTIQIEGITEFEEQHDKPSTPPTSNDSPSKQLKSIGIFKDIPQKDNSASHDIVNDFKLEPK